MSNPTPPQSGQAFPSLREPYGLSVRDYFFAKCVEGLLANPNSKPDRGETFDEVRRKLVLAAWDIANTMIDVRESAQ